MPVDLDQLKKFNSILDEINPDVVEGAFRDRYIRNGSVAFLDGSHVTTSFRKKTGCEDTLIWIIGGRAKTNNSGEAIIHLNQYLCLSHDEESVAQSYVPSILSAPNFVVTPQSGTPVFATTTITTEASNFDSALPIDADSNVEFPEILDVKVTVLTWNLDGSKAPNITFNWNCLIDGTRWSLFPG